VLFAPPLVVQELAVKIILLSQDAIRLEPEPGPLTIEAQSTEQSYSPFHMLASSLAYCTWSVMYSWAETTSLDASDLAIEVRWTFADDPHRVGEMMLTFEWPSLPEKRLNAAKRVAELCTVRATFMHPPTIRIEPAAVANVATEGTLAATELVSDEGA